MKISLVIPCFNEAQNLPSLLKRCSLLAVRPDVEIILVDNGSTDDTSEVLKNNIPNYPSCRSISVPINQGYGHGILEGLKVSNGEYLAWTHADMQTDPADILLALELLERESGNVFIKGRRYGRPIIDTFFTVGMSIFESILMRKLLWDINAQPTFFPRSFFDLWDNPPWDFSLDLYAYYLAKKMELKIIRFPVYFGRRFRGVSHWNVNFASKIKFIKRTVSFSLELKKRL